MSDLDAAELLKDLKTVSANLKRHIKDEGLRIGAELGKSHAKAAQDRIKAKDAELQRAQTRIHELEHHLKLREAERDARREAEKRLMNVRMCKVWIDDLGRKFVFCDELWHATDPDLHPEPKPARIDS